MSKELSYLSLAGMNFLQSGVTSEGGYYYGATPEILTAGNLIGIYKRLGELAKNDVLGSILEVMYSTRKRLDRVVESLTPKPATTPDPSAERAARELDCRGRAWAAYVAAGGSGDPGETFGNVSPTGDDWRSVLIKDMRLSVRSKNCLTVGAKIATLGELCELTANDLRELRNFGVSSLVEVRGRLAELGCKLKGDA